MKKILILTLITFALSGCTSNNTATKTSTTTVSELSTEEPTTTENANHIDEENIKEVNENSYMGIELNQDSGLSEEEASRYLADMPYIIYPEEGDTEYYCFRYPNFDAPLTVTQIEINDSKYHVFGISIGDDLAYAEEKLYDKGYKKEDFHVENTNLYSKGDVLIFLDYNELTIECIVVSLDLDTEEGVMY